MLGHMIIPFNFLRNYQTVFHSNYIVFISNNKYIRVTISLRSCQHFFLFFFFIMAILVSVKWYFIVVFLFLPKGKGGFYFLC